MDNGRRGRRGRGRGRGRKRSSEDRQANQDGSGQQDGQQGQQSKKRKTRARPNISQVHDLLGGGNNNSKRGRDRSRGGGNAGGNNRLGQTQGQVQGSGPGRGGAASSAASNLAAAATAAATAATATAAPGANVGAGGPKTLWKSSKKAARRGSAGSAGPGWTHDPAGSNCSNSPNLPGEAGAADVPGTQHAEDASPISRRQHPFAAKGPAMTTKGPASLGAVKPQGRVISLGGRKMVSLLGTGKSATRQTGWASTASATASAGAAQNTSGGGNGQGTKHQGANAAKVVARAPMPSGPVISEAKEATTSAMVTEAGSSAGAKEVAAAAKLPVQPAVKPAATAAAAAAAVKPAVTVAVAEPSGASSLRKAAPPLRSDEGHQAQQRQQQPAADDAMPSAAELKSSTDDVVPDADAAEVQPTAEKGATAEVPAVAEAKAKTTTSTGGAKPRAPMTGGVEESKGHGIALTEPSHHPGASTRDANDSGTAADSAAGGDAGASAATPAALTPTAAEVRGAAPPPSAFGLGAGRSWGPTFGMASPSPAQASITPLFGAAHRSDPLNPWFLSNGAPNFAKNTQRFQRSESALTQTSTQRTATNATSSNAAQSRAPAPTGISGTDVSSTRESEGGGEEWLKWYGFDEEAAKAAYAELKKKGLSDPVLSGTGHLSTTAAPMSTTISALTSSVQGGREKLMATLDEEKQALRDFEEKLMKALTE
ncbi:unnamed protein product [Chrysoparadoxa australica]